MEIRGRRFHVGIQLQPQRCSFEEYAAALRLVDRLGFDSVWNADHLLPYAGPVDGACLETLTTLSAMALLTERARIGVLVNGVLYRDPATLAKAAAQVDEMSGGRLEFSLGAAWAEREFSTYGLDFPPLAERFDRLEEAIEIVRLLWTEERTTYEGRYYRLLDAPCVPKPVQSPHPPITLGGAGRRTAALAARVATRLNVVGSPQACEGAFEHLRRACAEIGRDLGEIELSAHPALAVAASNDEARRRAGQIVAAHGGELGPDLSGWVLGTPAEALAQLRSYAAVGVSHVVLAVGHPFDEKMLQLVAAEILPELR